MDKGVPELFTDTEVYVTIGDVSSNDGVPRFIKPELNEVAFVPEVKNLKNLAPKFFFGSIRVNSIDDLKAVRPDGLLYLGNIVRQFGQIWSHCFYGTIHLKLLYNILLHFKGCQQHVLSLHQIFENNGPSWCLI